MNMTHHSLVLRTYQKTVVLKEKKRSASPPTEKNCAQQPSLYQLHYNISNWCCLFHQLEGLFPVWSQGPHLSTLQEAIANGPAATPLLGSLESKTHGEMLRNTTKIHVSKTWQHMYQDCMCSLRGKKKHGVFFSVFSNSTSFLKPKCLEDPKLFPMLPSPPQHDRQRCPVPAAATATAPTRIDSSSSFPSPQQRHWSLRHQIWGILMASLPGDSPSQQRKGREWRSVKIIFSRVGKLPSQILVSKQSDNI